MTFNKSHVIPEGRDVQFVVPKVSNKLFIVKMAGKAFLLTGLLVFALYARRYTFWLPHWKGDQNHYISLAMKLDQLGFDHFNLRGVNVRSMTLKIGSGGNITFAPRAEPGGITLIHPYLAENIHSRGNLLELLAYFGITYYDQPFFHKPTAFPFALMFSHRLFTRENQPYIVMLANIGPDLKKNLDLRVVFGLRSPPEHLQAFYAVLPIIFQAQFWAAVVPLFFSMGLIILTFILGKYLFSFRTGLYAAFMMTINPVAIMTSQKILADDMLAFFMLLAVILFLAAFKEKSRWPIAFLGGVSCGVAILAKQTGAVILISAGVMTVILVMEMIIRERNIKALKKTMPAVKTLFLFAFGTFCMSGFWFLRIYKEFGHPLWLPTGSGAGWSDLVSSRPAPHIFFLLGVPYLGPLFLPAILSLRDLFKELLGKIKGKGTGHEFLFLWLNIIVFLYFFATWQEHRRLLPIYPFIAVLAGLYWDRFRLSQGLYLKFFKNKYILEIVIIVIFGFSIFWSVPKGVEPSLQDNMLIQDPYPEFLP
jgi:hypothetical protein